MPAGSSRPNSSTIVRSARSPASWPYVSLSRRKLSMSTSATANAVPSSRARSTDRATASTSAPWFRVLVSGSRRVDSTRARVWRVIRPCAERKTRKRTNAATTAADRVTMTMLRRTSSSCARIGTASRQTPTIPTTWPSRLSGKYSRRTVAVPSAGPAAPLAATSTMSTTAVSPAAALANATEGADVVPRRVASSGEDHRPVGSPNLDAEDRLGGDERPQLALDDGLALTRERTRLEVVGRDEAAHEGPDDRRVGADDRAQRVRREMRRDHDGLRGGGHPDDHQEDRRRRGSAGPAAGRERAGRTRSTPVPAAFDPMSPP